MAAASCADQRFPAPPSRAGRGRPCRPAPVGHLGLAAGIALESGPAHRRRGRRMLLIRSAGFQVVAPHDHARVRRSGAGLARLSQFVPISATVSFRAAFVAERTGDQAGPVRFIHTAFRSFSFGQVDRGRGRGRVQSTSMSLSIGPGSPRVEIIDVAGHRQPGSRIFGTTGV